MDSRKYEINLRGYNTILVALMNIEERELKLRKVSGYTIDELTELFLSGAVEINKDRIPLSLINLKGEQYV